VTKYKKYIVLSTVVFSLFVLWIANQSFSIETRIDEENFPVIDKQSFFVDENIGQGLIYEGVLIDSYLMKKFGIIKLKTKNKNIDNLIDITIFPSLGELKINPLAGDMLKVVGLLKKYKKTFQIEPFDINSLTIIKEKTSCEKSITLKESRLYHTKTNYEIAPVTGISATPFRSKKGQLHLKIKVKWGNQIEAGIMWEDKWGNNDLKLIKSGVEICLYAKIKRYQGRLSLETARIFRHK
jgi:hypothetical protein